MNSVTASLFDRISETPVVGTALIRAFGLLKIPLIGFCRPSVVEMTENRSVVKLPYARRTKNHLDAMYIGALVAGADVAGGLTAMWRIQKSGQRVDLLFKELQVKFLKRVEGDAYFTCNDGPAISRAVEQTIQSGERVNLPVNITTTVPSKLGDEPVAEFVLTLTLKRR